MVTMSTSAMFKANIPVMDESGSSNALLGGTGYVRISVGVTNNVTITTGQFSVTIYDRPIQLRDLADFLNYKFVVIGFVDISELYYERIVAESQHTFSAIFKGINVNVDTPRGNVRWSSVTVGFPGCRIQYSVSDYCHMVPIYIMIKA